MNNLILFFLKYLHSSFFIFLKKKKANGITLVSKTDASLNYTLPASIWFGTAGLELKNICRFQKDLTSFAGDVGAIWHITGAVAQQRELS